MDVDSEIAFGIENAAVPPEELHRRLEILLMSYISVICRDEIYLNYPGAKNKKVAFASVYAMNPDIYLLDEPSSNLDMASIADLKKYLQY